MVNVKWMDYSGAPPILIPERFLGLWNGFYLPVEEEEEDVYGDGDFQLPDGRNFYIHDEFDFKNPKTDYDRICAKDGGSYLYQLGLGHSLVIQDYSDGTVGWWPEQNMLITVSRHLPDPSTFGHLNWENEIRWQIPDKRLYLLNPCMHGEQAKEPSPEVDIIDLTPGEYSIKAAESNEKYCVVLYRFERITA